MGKPAIRYESTQEPLDDEERELMDPDNWDWENACEIEPSPEPGLIFEVRLTCDDLAHVEQAAIAEDTTISAKPRCGAPFSTRHVEPKRRTAPAANCRASIPTLPDSRVNFIPC